MTDHNRRLRIGVFIEWLSDGYSDPVLEEIVSAAEERGVGIRCFVGGCDPLDFPTPRRHVPFVYASPEAIDGAIVVSMGNAATTSDLEELFSRLEPIPLCGMAIQWRRYPSVEVDNQTGVGDAVRHLIQKHGRCKIACIRGPKASTESDKRWHAYREALIEFGLAYDERYVVSGYYMREHGANAVRVLLDERRLDIDAIVAANDAMALGALEELRVRGIEVPKSVALLGFDDIDEARHVQPPLSTVRQPTREHARKAFDVVMAQLEGKLIARRTVVDSKFIVRRSCGCESSRGWMLSSAPPPAGSPRRRRTLDSWAQQSSRVLVEFFAPHPDASSLQNSLTELILRAAASGAKAPFLEIMDRELERLKVRADLLMALPLLDLRRRALRSVAAADSELELLDDLLNAAAALASEAAERSQAQQRYAAKEQINRLLRMNQSLMQTMTLAELARVVAGQLPHLGVRGCFACVCEGQDVPAAWARLVLACDSGTAKELPEGGLRFPAKEVLPKELGLDDTSSSWLICPAVAGCYVVLLCGTAEPFVYDSLVGEIASNVRRLDLLQQLQEANRQLEKMAHTDPLTGLRNRRYLVNELELEFRRAKRYGLDLSCALVDVDHFKRINDTYGHLAGDGVLQEVAAVMAAHSRSTDRAGRYGGEEFCLVLTHTALDDAAVTAEKLRSLIAQLEFLEDGRSFGVTVSIGVTQMRTEDQTTADMIRRADEALYRAKSCGRDRVERE